MTSRTHDQDVTQYYDLRDANRRIDSFTKQIAGAKLDNHETTRDQLSAALQHQGLALDCNNVSTIKRLTGTLSVSFTFLKWSSRTILYSNIFHRLIIMDEDGP